jgi:hypothetical protein
MSGMREILQARKIFSVSLRGIRKSAGLLISWIDSLVGISGQTNHHYALGIERSEAAPAGQHRRNPR